MALLIITALLLTGYASLIFYYYHHWQKLPLYTAKEEAPATPISVVIAARNERAHLPQLLQALVQQTYPKHLWELIIVDDFSTDGTPAAVQPYLNERVKMIHPGGAAAQSSKKKAIASGVAAATGELMVITDADCIPPPEWLQTIESLYRQKGTQFIAAPVTFTNNGSLLQVFQALDFMTLQGITAASVAAGFHSMCNGANLAYTKRAFMAVNGFEGIDAVASGDDMLLMHKIKKRYPAGIQYLKSKDAIVSTAPMPTWKDFVAQRRRWASKTTHYDDKNVFYVLLFVYVFNCWFIVLLIAACFNSNQWYLVFGFWLLKTIIEWPFMQSVARFYNAQKLLWYFPMLQPLHMLYTVSVGFISQLGSYEWKGRKTK